MAADGSVVFATELDSSGLKSGLKSIAGVGGKFAKGFGIAIAGVSTAFAGLAKMGIAYNSQMENFQTNFTVLLGDEAAALDYVAQMREKAAKTPFGMEDLANASQTMLAFGISAEDSMKYIDMLGDISLGNKDKLGALSLAFSQVSAAGKLTGQDLLQMINAGFNPLQTISEKTGASIADLKDVMAGGKGSKEFQKLVKDAQKEVALLGDNASESSKMLAQIGEEGMISADMVGQAMEIETSEGGRFYQGMLKASKTMSGIISTLKDDAMALIGNVFAPLTATIAEGVLPLVSGYLSSLTDAFEKGGTEGLINRLGTVIADIFIRASEALPGVIDIATNILTTIVKSITRVAPKLAKSASSALASFIKGAAAFLPVLTEAAGSLLTEIASSLSVNLPELLSDLAGGLMDSLLAIDWEALIASLATLLDSLVTGIFDALWVIAPKLGELIVEIGAALIKSLPQLLTTIGDAIIEGLNFFFGTNIPKISEIDFPSWDEIKDACSKWWEKTKANIEKVMDIIFFLFGFKGWNEELRQQTEREWQIIKSKIVEMIDAVLIKLRLPTVAEFKEIVDASREAIKQTIEDALSFTLGINIDFDSLQRQLIEWWNSGWLAQNMPFLQINKQDSNHSGVGGGYGGSDAFVYYAQKMADMEKALQNLSGRGTRSSNAPSQSVYSAGAKTRDKIRAQIASESSEFGQLGSDIAQYISEGLNNSAADFVGSFSRSIEANSGHMRESGLSLAENIADGAELGESLLSNAFEGLIDTAKENAIARAREFQDVGTRIPEGIAQGIERGESILTQAIERMVDDALSAARKRAQIHSPSRLFENEFGEYLPAGAARGVDKNSHLLQASVQRMVDNSLPDMANFGAGLGSWNAFERAAAGSIFQQTNNFNLPVQTPDEFAATMHQYATYGMAGEA